MIAPGAQLPTDFKLKVIHDGKEKEVAFRDLLRRRTIVSIYMKNNTGSCDKQNASLAEHAGEFAQLGYDLVAVSRDSIASHGKYAAKMGISYTLASDPDDQFARAADAIVEKSMYGKKYLGPARAAFVLAPDGRVLAVVEKVETKDHAAQLRAVLATLPK